MCVLFVLLRSVEHWCHNARPGSDGDASQFLFLSAGYYRELLLPVRHLVFSEFLHESLSFLLRFSPLPCSGVPLGSPPCLLFPIVCRNF